MGRLRNLIEEARELGAGNFAFRLGFELKRRSGWLARTSAPAPDTSKAEAWSVGGLLDRRLFAPAHDVAKALSATADWADSWLLQSADEEARGRLLAFSSQSFDYGDPIDWHRHPLTGLRSHPADHWSKVRGSDAAFGDVKFILEPGRFPHAYRMARAAVRFPEHAPRWAHALSAQVEHFRRSNPFGLGPHWFSSQEVALRLLAWIFAHDVFVGLGLDGSRLRRSIEAASIEAGVHILEHFDYSRRSTYNNHLLSEAFGLLLVGSVAPGWSEATRCRVLGLSTLAGQSDPQFYKDGSYILNSHNYHRGAVQLLLVVDRTCEAMKEETPGSLLRAMERSLDFLHAHQNPDDGLLPNYGPNDGSLPMILSTCAFADFRPTLQAASLRCRAERLYGEGPWDEEAAWLSGPSALSAPLRPRARASVVFAETGYVVIRGKREDDFACIRCGDIPSRFSQIDMLHLDLWWRGENVLVDGGSYLYNGSPHWHRHFHRTAGHNTVEIDGQDQMLHFRPFKNLYWTKGRVRAFTVRDEGAVFEGEHDGYRRLDTAVVHRRRVVTDREGGWLVRDQIQGAGRHRVRLHWLIAPFPVKFSTTKSQVNVETPKGGLTISISGAPSGFETSLVSGQENPPRGWIARNYGEKTSAHSLVVEGSSNLPVQIETWIVPSDSAEASRQRLREISETES